MSIVRKIFQLFFQICQNNHIAKKWCSQPILQRGVLLGNMMLSTAILCSGNNFAKQNLLCKYLHLGCPSDSTFHRFQQQCIGPAITDFWTIIRDQELAQLKGHEIIIAGKEYGYLTEKFDFLLNRRNIIWQ